MIQPNELRIGNWLLYEGKPTQVEAIDPEREVKELDLSCAIRIKEYFTTPGGPYTTNGRWLNHFNTSTHMKAKDSANTITCGPVMVPRSGNDGKCRPIQ